MPCNPKGQFERIFGRTNLLTMEKQYCKVGAVTSIMNGSEAVAILEYQYQNFLAKATDANYIGTTLGEFFERKAQSIKNALENLV